MTAGHIRIPSADIQQFWSVHSWFLMCLRLFIFVLQTVSYARFLLPTNALVRQKSNIPLDTGTVQTPMSRNWINGQKNFSHQRFSSTVGQEAGVLPRHWNNIAAIFTVVMRRVSFDILHIMSVSSTGADELSDYDPNLLSDPQWPCGKHKRVLIFSSYVVSFFILEHQHHSLMSYKHIT